MKTETQNQKIYEYLKQGNSISAMKALNLFQCFRLSARILDIKKNFLQKNEIIKREMVKLDNQKHVAKYSIKTL